MIPSNAIAAGLLAAVLLHAADARLHEAVKAAIDRVKALVELASRSTTGQPGATSLHDAA
jgi:hypothetical protein